MTYLDPNVNWDAVQGLVDNVRSLYPTMSWMLDVPELSGIIIQAGIENWDEGRLVSALQGTSWWQSRNQAQRAQEQLFRTDPATWEQQKGSVKTQILQFAGSNGLSLSDAEADYIAFYAYTNGWSAAEWQANVVNYTMGQKGQSAAGIGAQLKQMAGQYAIPISDGTLKQWEQNILLGTANQSTFMAYVQEQAKSLYPGLANAIDMGITVQQYVAPYAEVASQELGVNANSIVWTDPKWNVALHQIDPKTGAPVSMSLSEWTRELRTNAIYGFAETDRAKELASQLGTGLAELFGRAA